MSAPAISAARGTPIRLPVRLLGDDRLAALAAAGDAGAFDALYRRHHRALYAYCRAMVRHEQDAQDVLQNTMTKALTAMAAKSPDAPLRAWLFRIAHNEAVNLLRRRREHLDTTAAEGMAAPPHEPALEARERLRLLVDDLQDLPERQRTALVMRELSGASHREIGQTLEMSEGAAKQAVLDARLSLAEFAKGRAMICADVQRLVSDRDGRKLRGRAVRAHLRTCGDCRRLRDAIGPRQADLAVLAPPLPAATVAALLAKALGGAGSGSAGGGLAVATAKVAATPLLTKAIAAGAVLATAGVATEEVIRQGDAQVRRPAPAAVTPAAPGVDGRRPATTQPASSRSRATPAEAGEPRRRVRRADPRRHNPRRLKNTRAKVVNASPVTAPSGGGPGAARGNGHSPAAPPARSKPKPSVTGKARPRKAHPAHPAHPAPSRPEPRKSKPAPPAEARPQRAPKGNAAPAAPAPTQAAPTPTATEAPAEASPE